MEGQRLRGSLSGEQTMLPACEAGGRHDDPRIETRLRVMTWNLWWRFGPWEARLPGDRRDPGPARRRRDLPPGGVGGRDAEPGRRAGRPGSASTTCTAAGSTSTGSGSGNAVLSRWPIAEPRRRCRCPRPRTPRSCAPCVRADIDGPRGTLQVFSTHLNWRFDQSDVRQDQVRGDRQFVDELARCGPYSADPVRRLQRRPRQRRDPHAHRSRRAAGAEARVPRRVGGGGRASRTDRGSRGRTTTRTPARTSSRTAASTTCSSAGPRPRAPATCCARQSSAPRRSTACSRATTTASSPNSATDPPAASRRTPGGRGPHRGHGAPTFVKAGPISVFPYPPASMAAWHRSGSSSARVGSSAARTTPARSPRWPRRRDGTRATPTCIVGTSAGSIAAAALRAGLSGRGSARRSTGATLSPEGALLVGHLTPVLELPTRPPFPRGLPLPASPQLAATALLPPWSARPLAALAGLLPAGNVPTAPIGDRIRQMMDGEVARSRVVDLRVASA